MRLRYDNGFWRRGLRRKVLGFLASAETGSQYLAWERRVCAERERGVRLICLQGCVFENRFQASREPSDEAARETVMGRSGEGKC